MSVYQTFSPNYVITFPNFFYNLIWNLLSCEIERLTSVNSTLTLYLLLYVTSSIYLETKLVFCRIFFQQSLVKIPFLYKYKTKSISGKPMFVFMMSPLYFLKSFYIICFIILIFPLLRDPASRACFFKNREKYFELKKS